MANVKITELTNLTDPSTTDVMPVVDVDADVTKKVSVGEVVGKISGDVNVATDGTSSIASGVIVNDDINASAAIADTKLDTISTAGKVSNSATTATNANTASAIVARDASGDFSAGTITADLTGNADTATALSSSRTFAVTGDVTGTVSSDLTSGASIATSIASGVIVDGDVNAAAGIAGTKIDPDFGSQTVETTGVINAGSGTEAAPAVTVGTADNGLYSPGTNQLAISTNGTGRLFVDASGKVGVGTTNPADKLSVAGSSATDFRALTLRNSSGTTGSAAVLTFEASSGTEGSTSAIASQIKGVREGSGTSGGLEFWTSKAGTPYQRARFDISGRLLVGTSSAPSNVYPSTVAQTPANVFDSDTDQISLMMNNNSASGNIVSFAQRRNAAAGGNISRLIFSQYDGSNYRTAAQIAAQIDGTPGVADVPGRLVFSVTADGASSPTEALRISNDRSITVSDGGDVVLGTTTGTKIGTATSQKIGFYNATPVVQPTAVADITTTATSGSLPTPDGSVTIADAATPTVTELLEYCVELEAKLEAALGHLRNLGLIAT